MLRAYRIVEIKNGKPHSLFHSINGSLRGREIPMGRWIRAANRYSSDGGAKYTTGFHVFLNQHDAVRYFTRAFRKHEGRQVIECEVRDIRPKDNSPHPIFLADWMKVNNLEAPEYP